MPIKKKKTKVKKKVTKRVTKKTKVKRKVISKVAKESSKELIIKTKPQWIKSSLTNKSKYQDKYSQSIKNNDEFWRKEGKRITWIKPYKKIKDIKKIAITAGASAPENRVQEIAESIQIVTGGTISEVGKDEENIVFKMPPELRREKVQ